jgi:two-component system OmpR family response regulator
MYTDKTRRISIVEDNHSFQQMLKDFFERKFPGVTVSVYSSGEDFLEKYANDSDLVLLDFNLDSKDPAAMNGLQILKSLKTREPDAQVIFLSANDSAEIAASVISEGAYYYVVKNEHAFARLEIILRNVFHQQGINKNLKTQRFFNIVLVAMLVILLGLIVFRRLGM